MTRYLAAQLAGDAREAVRLITDEGLAAGMSPHEIHLHVVAEAQRELGRLWQENRISVADEHQATAISHLVLSHVYPSLERGKRLAKRVVVGCVAGELHEMPARIAADLLESAGFDVIFLGADVPTPSLVAKLIAVKADALALAVTMTFHFPAARAAVRAVREALGETFPIFIGGAAVVRAPAPFDGVHLSHGSALELVSTARHILGVAA